MDHIYQKELVGVFGDPVDDNPSVVVNQAAFEAVNIPMQYLTIQVKKGNLGKAIEGMKAMNFRGINITMPYKREVLNYLDEISDDARIMGAVNTVINNGGLLYGENTDGKGFIRNLQDGGVQVQGKNVVVLGAGGGARGITVELAKTGVGKITILNVVEDDGVELQKLLQENFDIKTDFTFWKETYQLPVDTEILINATPVGFKDFSEKPNIDYETISKNMVVCDVIPNREHTLFLDEAVSRGCRTFDGLRMLANGCAIAFEMWTNKKAPIEVMVNALKEAYGISDD